MKGKSGLNKIEHMYVLVNGALYCNLYNTTMHQKLNQHLVGKKHDEKYEEKKRFKALVKKKLSMKACISSKEVEELMLNQAVHELKENRIDEGLSDTRVSTQLTTY